MGMNKKVVRCNVCSKVHGLDDLLNLKQLFNGTCTYICPVTKVAGTYRLESVGTLNLKPIDPEPYPNAPAGVSAKIASNDIRKGDCF